MHQKPTKLNKLKERKKLKEKLKEEKKKSTIKHGTSR